MLLMNHKETSVDYFVVGINVTLFVLFLCCTYATYIQYSYIFNETAIKVSFITTGYMTLTFNSVSIKREILSQK